MGTAYQVGDRVQMLKVRPVSTHHFEHVAVFGTVATVFSSGSIHVRWDDGEFSQPGLDYLMKLPRRDVPASRPFSQGHIFKEHTVAKNVKTVKTVTSTKSKSQTPLKDEGQKAGAKALEKASKSNAAAKPVKVVKADKPVQISGQEGKVNDAKKPAAKVVKRKEAEPMGQPTGKTKAAKTAKAADTSKAEQKKQDRLGHTVGVTLGLNVKSTWIHLFETNESLPKAKKMTDEAITKFMRAEFPKNTTTKEYDHPQRTRAWYNRGSFHKGVQPKIQSHRYDDAGNQQPGYLRKPRDPGLAAKHGVSGGVKQAAKAGSAAPQKVSGKVATKGGTKADPKSPVKELGRFQLKTKKS